MAKANPELPWAAGFFDGEGYASVNRMPSGNYLRIVVANTEEQVIQRFHDAVGVGRISGPYSSTKPNHRPVWYWRASSYEAEAVIQMLWPWLSDHSHRKIESARAQVGSALVAEGGQSHR